jgi:hypothetical protein
MNKKAQLTIFFIIGIVFLITLTFFFLKSSETTDFEQSSDLYLDSNLEKENLKQYFEQCSKNAIIKTNKDLGINEQSKEKYLFDLNLEIEYCMLDYTTSLENKGYDIEYETLNSDVEFNDNTIVLTINYPITVTGKGTEFSLSSHIETFGKSQSIKLENGIVTKDTIVNAPDNSARFVLKEGTKVTDDKGNPLNEVSIKLNDVHFDGLENSIVIGNLVYEGLPDGAQFSEPIDVQISFQQKDLPTGFTEKYAGIAYWDEELKIWRGLDSDVEDGQATAQVDHFTTFSVVLGCDEDSADKNTYETPYLFKQKYDYITLRETNDDGFLEDESVFIDRSKKEKKEFCSSGWDEEFEENKDLIKPINENYKEFLNDRTKGLALTNLEIDIDPSIIIYGEGECDLAKEEYVCCVINDEPSISTIQDCEVLDGETNPLDDAKCESIEKIDYPLSNIHSEEFNDKEGTFFGYASRSCIGGKIETDKSNPLVSVQFSKGDNVGGDCISDPEIERMLKIVDSKLKSDSIEGDNSRKDAILEELKDPYSNHICEVDWFLNPKSQSIDIFSVDVSAPDKNYCASCRAEISLLGIFSKNSLFAQNNYVSCEVEGENKYFYEDGKSVCKTCMNDGNKLKYKNSDDPNACICSQTTVGTAWCQFPYDVSGIEGVDPNNPKVICDENHKLVAWPDEENRCNDCLTDPTLDKCGITVPYNGGQ